MGLLSAYAELNAEPGAEVARDVRLAPRTSYRIGGPADLLVTCHDFASLARTVDVLSAQAVPWVLMGRGSNLLVADAGYRGCVVMLGRDFSRVDVSVDDGVVCAGAATALSRVVSCAMRASLSGLEFACGVPGTVGGAIAMDAGTRREWIGHRVDSIVTLSPGRGMRRWLASDVEWGYRWTSLPKDEIVLEASLRLEHGDREAIGAAMQERLERKRATQPLSRPSCGSVFRNPPDGPGVAQMVEALGLKGHRVGGASVSELHANFVVNDGTATATDVLSVMAAMHDGVRDAYGVDLLPEVKFLGFGE